MTNRNYRRDYQSSHDIDWFALCNGVPIHVASNGGEIPRVIKNDANSQNQAFFAHLKSFLSDEDIVINEEWLNELDTRLSDHNPLPNNVSSAYVFDKEAYIRTFVEFAKLGLVSIDCANIEEEHNYKVVAYPKDRKNIGISLRTNNTVGLPIVSLDEMQNINLNLW